MKQFIIAKTYDLDETFRTHLLSKFLEYVCTPVLLLVQSPSAHPIALERALDFFAFYLEQSGGGPNIPTSVVLEGIRILPLIIQHGRATVEAAKAKAVNTNEELKLAGIRCLNLLVASVTYMSKRDSSSSSKSSEEINDETTGSLRIFVVPRKADLHDDIPAFDPAHPSYKQNSKLHLAHLIGVLIEMAKVEKSLKIRSTSLSAVSDWCRFINLPAVLNAFLPGIVSALAKIFENSQDKPKLHSSLVVSGLELLVSLLSCCYGKSSALKDLSENMDKLLLSLRIIFKNSYYLSWRARSATCRASYELIISCCLTLPMTEGSHAEMFQLLLDSAMAYIDDPVAEVRRQCTKYVAGISKRAKEVPRPKMDDIKTGKTKTFNQIVLHTFEMSLLDLPAVLKEKVGFEEEIKLSATRKVIGYLLLVGRKGFQTATYSSFSTFIRQFLLSLRDMRLDHVWLKGSNAGTEQYFERKKIAEVPAKGDNSVLEEPSKRAPLVSKDVSSEGLLSIEDTSLRFRSEALTNSIKRLLRFFGRLGDVALMVDTLIEYLSEISTAESEKPLDFSIEAAFVLNEICFGLNQSDEPGSSEMFEFDDIRIGNDPELLKQPALFAMVQSVCLWNSRVNAPSTNATEKTTTTSLNNVILCDVLVVEGIGIVALILKWDFAPLLIDTFYLLMEKAGSSVAWVRTTAIQSLRIVATFNAESQLVDTTSAELQPISRIQQASQELSSLVCSNVDYLVNEVTFRLHYLRDNPFSPRMLMACLRLGGTSILPYFNDALYEISTCLDEHRSEPELVYELVRVYDELSSILIVASDSDNEKAKSGNPNVGLIESADVDDDDQVQNNDILKFFADTRKEEGYYAMSDALFPSEESSLPFSDRKEIRETRDEESSLQGGLLDKVDPGPVGPMASPENEVTLAQKLFLEPAEGMISKCQYLLYADNAPLRALVLRVIKKSVVAFRDRFPNRLNPLIHKLWPLVLSRLSDPEQYVVSEGLDLIHAIIGGGKDFLSQRLSRDLIPKCLPILKELSKGIEKSLKPSIKRNLWTTQVSTVAKSQMPDQQYGKSFFNGLFDVLIEGVRHGSLSRFDLQTLNDHLWPLLRNAPPPASTTFQVDDVKTLKLIQGLARTTILEIGKRSPDIVWLTFAASKGILTLHPSKHFDNYDHTISNLAVLQMPNYLTQQFGMTPQALVENDDFLKEIEHLGRGSMLLR
ncbi:TEL2-interacting protein 1 [Phlyctochytrium planicorne]|nr:TEL2-interacting protein 1 [Phlyctochytrium planicorne]